MTIKTNPQWAQIAENTLADGDATAEEEIRSEMVASPDLRDVAEAADEVAAAEARLREAVQIARTNGRSWKRIATALGTSGQAARVRFAGTGAAGAEGGGRSSQAPVQDRDR